MEGGIGPPLRGNTFDEEDLFRIIYDGVADKGMPAFNNLGTERVWQLVNLIKYNQPTGE